MDQAFLGEYKKRIGKQDKSISLNLMSYVDKSEEINIRMKKEYLKLKREKDKMKSE